MKGNVRDALIIIIVTFLAIFLMAAWMNACTSRKWNDGICEKCNEAYEVHGIEGLAKYYVCPECGEDVWRMLN